MNNNVSLGKEKVCMKYSLIIVSICMLFAGCKKETSLQKTASYDTSLTIDWMRDLQLKYPNTEITLKDICLPSAHDAGVYELNNCLGGNDCNTKTQYLNMGMMLASGVRVFDLRPTLINGVYWTFHRTNCGGLGCEGVQLRTFLEETKSYLDQHNELVIFEITHLCNTGSQDPGLIALFNDILGNTKYTLNSNLPSTLILTPLQEIIPANGNGGKVVLLWEDVSAATENRSEGIFDYNFLPTSGGYSNNKDIDIVIANQLLKFNNFNEASKELFELSYTFTLDAGALVSCLSGPENSVSIESIALDGRSRLKETIDTWIASGSITANKIPNILSIDFSNTIVTEQCIRLSELSLQ